MQDIQEINDLIKYISKLPGLGPKSARRIILKLINNKSVITAKILVKNLIKYVLLKILLINGVLKVQVFFKDIFIFLGGLYLIQIMEINASY